MAAETHIYIYGCIGGGDPFFGGGVAAKDIAEQISKSKGEIILHIDSPGGSVYEGYTIYNILTGSGRKVSAIVEGMCASIATLIALSATDITMRPLAQWLVHLPFAGIEGTAEELRTAAADLDKIEKTLVDIYVSRTGKTPEEMKSLMLEDKFLSAQEAKDLGFATEVSEPLKAVAFLKSKHIQNNMENTEIKNKLSIIEKILNRVFKVKNMDVKTKDGGTLAIEPGIEEGATVMIDTAPAPDGDIVLEDGTTITILDGLIMKVTSPEPAGDNGAAEIAALKAEIETLKATNTAAATEKATLITAITEMKAEFTALKTLTVGSGGAPATPPQGDARTPKNKSVWDDVITNAKSK